MAVLGVGTGNCWPRGGKRRERLSIGVYWEGSGGGNTRCWRVYRPKGLKMHIGRRGGGYGRCVAMGLGVV